MQRQCAIIGGFREPTDTVSAGLSRYPEMVKIRSIVEGTHEKAEPHIFASAGQHLRS
jgi:hypothetical protein